jgi:CYTH domain-containing protein/phosphohistidine phosphatase SixA
MAIEIERKFLVKAEGWRRRAAGKTYRQGYLSVDPERTVRVRIAGEEGFLTIKGKTEGMARSEFEYPIPLTDAAHLLDSLCMHPLIEKTRYSLEFEGRTWEIDEFGGDNLGLVLAEVELDSENEQVILPPWVGEEVTGDRRYYNASLIQNPFSKWQVSPMKRLTLLRHAKSSWSDPDLDDFDRPLNKRGQRDAPKMGRRLAERGFLPDAVLSSPARRVRLTVEAVAAQIDIDPTIVRYDRRIYLATDHQLLDLVRAIPENLENVLLVGHNPGITDLANYLVGGSLENIPTCAVFGVDLQVSSWRQVNRAGARLLFYDFPKKNDE